MAQFTFDVVDVTLKRTLRLDREGYRGLFYHLEPERDIMVLKTGETLCSPKSYKTKVDDANVRTSAEFEIYLRDQEDQDGVLGQLIYVKSFTTDDGVEPSSIFLQAGFPAKDFQTLWDAALHGTSPTSFTFEFKDVSYSWEPDGSGKTWDNETSSKVEIEIVSWALQYPRPADR
jgi:hypothetical protein